MGSPVEAERKRENQRKATNHYIHMYKDIHVHVHIHLYMCIYIYVYIYAHIRIIPCSSFLAPAVFLAIVTALSALASAQRF